MAQKNSINNIQMLRAIAAILVIMHHTLPHYHTMGGTLSWINNISTWGFLGVDIFFVISGFIMAYTTFYKERTFIHAISFLKHRLFRIFLGYWPFFITMLIIILATYPNRLSHLDIWGSLLLINDNMFQLILPVSWSLSFELYFYFLFFFTFFIRIRYLYIFIPISIILLFTYILFYANSHSFFYSPFLLEFFFGVLLYMYKDYLMKLWLVPIAILLIFLAYGYGIEHETKNGILRILTFGSGAAFIVLVALIIEEKNVYQANKYFTALGDASYTLYLSHLIILDFFWRSGIRDIFNSNTIILPLLGFLLILILCILFSLFFYKNIEKPLYKKSIQKKLFSNKS